MRIIIICFLLNKCTLTKINFKINMNENSRKKKKREKVIDFNKNTLC